MALKSDIPRFTFLFLLTYIVIPGTSVLPFPSDFPQLGKGGINSDVAELYRSAGLNGTWQRGGELPV